MSRGTHRAALLATLVVALGFAGPAAGLGTVDMIYTGVAPPPRSTSRSA